ncbi:MAG TPA: hypothetical protein VLC55_05635 [Burkholderiales bacterium]|nr:hypothetical protein [Burkholderiales bacterium]
MKTTVITALLLTSFGVAHAASPEMSAADKQEPSPLSIAIDGQKGASFRLVYMAGHGWKFADHSGPKLASANPQEGTTGPLQALPTETPQSVVIDGPTGYVFVYLIDEGWRFVGNVADTRR